MVLSADVSPACRHAVPAIRDDSVVVPDRSGDRLVLTDGTIVARVVPDDNVVRKGRVSSPILNCGLIGSPFEPAAGDNAPDWVGVAVLMFDVDRLASSPSREVSDVDRLTVEVFAIHSSDPDAEVDETAGAVAILGDYRTVPKPERLILNDV